MDHETRTVVWQRADGTCEYCRLWQEHEPFVRFQVEHITPNKHGGTDALHNLALACYFCNTHKSSSLTGIDPKTKRIVRLFNPRQQRWDRHFRWDGINIVGKNAHWPRDGRGLRDESAGPTGAARIAADARPVALRLTAK